MYTVHCKIKRELHIQYTYKSTFIHLVLFRFPAPYTEKNVLLGLHHCSTLGTPLFNISEFLSSSLTKTTTQSSSSIKNSIEFKEKIKNIKLPDNYVLISLDVVSLFSNIDSDLALTCIDKRWKEIIKNANLKRITKKLLLEMFDLVLNNCEFTFNDIMYKQIFGSPMGSPVSPAVADLVMEYVETNVLKNFDFHIPFFYRYVDDIITAVPSNKVDDVLSEFNRFNQHIQFTHELEKNSQISFLDILIHHNPDGSLNFDWYHKDTWSARYMNFNSNMPLTYKRNTINLLAEKIIKISDNKFHQKNFKLLESILLMNNYPLKFIKSQFHLTKCKLFQNTNPQLNQQTEIPIYASFPYLHGIFESTKNIMKHYGVNLVAKGCYYNNQLFSQLKDRDHKNNQTHVIYEVTCECSQKYVGQTKQHLKKRIYRHSYDARAENPKNQSALSEHLKLTQHKISMDDVTIKAKEVNYIKRNVLEMLHIKRCNNALNKQEDLKIIEHTYDNIIK